MGEREAFERVLESLYKAALDDARLPAASALMDEALQARGNSLAFGDVSPGEEALVYDLSIFSRGCRRREREYFEDYFALDERLPRLGCTMNTWRAWRPATPWPCAWRDPAARASSGPSTTRWTARAGPPRVSP